MLEIRFNPFRRRLNILSANFFNQLNANKEVLFCLTLRNLLEIRSNPEVPRSTNLHSMKCRAPWVWQQNYNCGQNTHRHIDLIKRGGQFYYYSEIIMRPEDSLHLEQIRKLGSIIKKNVGSKTTKVRHEKGLNELQRIYQSRVNC